TGDRRRSRDAARHARPRAAAARPRRRRRPGCAMIFGDKRDMVRIPTAVFLCAAALVLGGCETARNLNPFAEKDEVIPGERQPVFGPDSGFDGPRKLPPPNSDYVGATIRADQPVPPSQPATGTMGVETA